MDQIKDSRLRVRRRFSLPFVFGENIKCMHRCIIDSKKKKENKEKCQVNLDQYTARTTIMEI